MSEENNKTIRLFKNNKSGNYYRFCGTAKNATNAVVGQKVVIYRAHTDLDTDTFVRELKEFYSKFTEQEVIG